MSLRRPTAACLLFIYSFISPLCDVAQTSNCGTHCLSFSVMSPLCGVAPTPDCGINILAFSSRGVIQTLVWHRHYYSCSSSRGVIQTLAQCISVTSVLHVHFSLCTRASPYFCLLHGRLIIINVSEYDYLLLYYTRVLNVCEYIQTYSLACPWLLSWPDSLRGQRVTTTAPEPL